MSNRQTGVLVGLVDQRRVHKAVSLNNPHGLEDALILDALLSIPVALLAVNVNNLESALAAPMVVVIATADSLIRVIYRAALKWAQSS